MNLNVRVAGNGVRITRVLIAATLLSLAAAIVFGTTLNIPLATREDPSSGNASAAELTKPRPALAQAPLTFEPNQGQSDARVKFLSRGRGYALFLTTDEAVLKAQSLKPRGRSAVQHSAVGSDSPAVTTAVVRMKVVGANPDVPITAESELPSKSNYFVGNDPAKWRVNVPQFGKVRYQGIYPGVDLVYYGSEGRLEYDFELAAGADPKHIELSFAGAEALRVDQRGNLIAETGAGAVQLQAPVAYQQTTDEKRLVPAKFLVSGRRVKFSVGPYDRTRKLVIDPTLTYSTYLGGSLNEGCLAVLGAVRSGCPAIAVDGALNMYVAGTTASSFPTTAGVYQSTLKGAANVFVTKFNSSGSQLLFSTYLGGTGIDSPVGIAVDPLSGNVYVAGNTTSADFPAHNAFQGGPLSTANHAFVTVLNPAATALVYSTYLSGHGVDTATGLAIDNRAGAYVTGFTTSTDSGTGFPSTTSAFQKSSLAASQFFFTKLNTAATGAGSVSYSSYLGGSVSASGNPANETQGGGIAVDRSGYVYLTGGTDFTNMPVLNAAQAASKGGADVFVAKFNPGVAGAAGRVYLTYVGGTGDDVGNGISVDASGSAYVTGSTTSADIAASSTAFQKTPGGGVDALLLKIGNPVAPSVIYPVNYFSYLGGAGSDTGLAVAVDGNQTAHIAGSSNSGGAGATDALVAQISTTGSTGSSSTYLGDTGDDDATGVATDGNGATYVAGETTSTNFPTVAALQGSSGGAADAFVAKFTPASALVVSAAPSAGTVGLGNAVTFNYTIANPSSGSDIASNVIFTSVLPSGATFNSVTATPGACTAVVNGAVTCSIGTLGLGASAKVAISVTPTAAGTVTSSATVTANGSNTFSASAAATVTDFVPAVTPASNTVAAGTSATYQVTLTPASAQGFPNSISLSCSAGVPTGAACTFSTNPVTPNTSPVSSTLTISTTARPVTSASGTNPVWYAALLPVGGLALMGMAGAGSGKKGRMGGMMVLLLLTLSGIQLACGGNKATPPPNNGTPAGTYSITLTATSGNVSHATKLTLVVQ